MYTELPLAIVQPDALKNFVELVVRVLAVAGGAAVGAFVTGWGVRLLTRALVHRQVPPKALAVVRALGAVAFGIAVYFLVFGSGGPGYGLGGGGWGFGGKGAVGDDGDSKHAGKSTKDKDKNKDGDEGKPIPPKPDDTIRVVLLGGDRVIDDRFYQVGGDPTPSSLAEVQSQIEGHQPPVRIVEIVIYLNSVAESHPAVVKLKQWAEDRKLTVKTTKPARESP